MLLFFFFKYLNLISPMHHCPHSHIQKKRNGRKEFVLYLFSRPDNTLLLFLPFSMSVSPAVSSFLSRGFLQFSSVLWGSNTHRMLELIIHPPLVLLLLLLYFYSILPPSSSSTCIQQQQVISVKGAAPVSETFEIVTLGIGRR